MSLIKNLTGYTCTIPEFQKYGDFTVYQYIGTESPDGNKGILLLLLINIIPGDYIQSVLMTMVVDSKEPYTRGNELLLNSYVNYMPLVVFPLKIFDNALAQLFNEFTISIVEGPGVESFKSQTAAAEAVQPTVDKSKLH